ncbi:MAG: preprotein translocase subunit SecE [Spirochaetae bacterium HGW-Spirochaetae-10]|nr:MAG: preprotein translocase subunit SecE [Spirochaetae bacterium HGW-Spirochaetae-10]
MKRVVWPNRKEVVNSSVVVIVTLLFFKSGHAPVELGLWPPRMLPTEFIEHGHGTFLSKSMQGLVADLSM